MAGIRADNNKENISVVFLYHKNRETPLTEPLATLH